MFRAARALVAVAAVCALALALPVATEQLAAADGTSARVTLIDAGAAPRAPMRLALVEGEVARRDLTFQQTVEQSIDGEPTGSVDVPPITMTLEQTVGSVAPDGVAELSYGYTAFAVADDASFEPADRAQFESALEPLMQVTGSSSITTRNQAVDADVDGLDGLDPTLARSLTQLTDQAGSLAVPFPKENVGAGARWRGVSTITVSGIETQQTYEYTLRERDGDTAVVGVSYVQTAKRQRAEIPGVPDDATVRVRRYRITGDGESTIDLTQSLPIASHMRASGRQVLFVRANGEAGELTQDLELSVEVEVPLLDRTSG